MNTRERLKYPKEWKVPYDDSPLALQAFRTYGPLGLFMHHNITMLGINKSQITLIDLLESIIILYMNNYSQHLVFLANYYRNIKTSSQGRIWRRSCCCYQVQRV